MPSQEHRLHLIGPKTRPYARPANALGNTHHANRKPQRGGTISRLPSQLPLPWTTSNIALF
jgi:hypothetical protein